jgi:hypothetical protein
MIMIQEKNNYGILLPVAFVRSRKTNKFAPRAKAISKHFLHRIQSLSPLIPSHRHDVLGETNSSGSVLRVLRGEISDRATNIHLRFKNMDNPSDTKIFQLNSSKVAPIISTRSRWTGFPAELIPDEQEVHLLDRRAAFLGRHS